MIIILNLSFADDFIFPSEYETMLQRMLSSLLTYCLYSKLKVNTDKSKIMVVQRRKKATAPGWKTLEFVKEYKYLGLMFSSNGTFKHAPMTLSNQANKALFLLIKWTIRLGHPSPKSLPIHEYGSEIFSS